MDKGKERWLRKFDYLINNRKLISIFALFWFTICLTLSFLMAFEILSIYWTIFFGFGFTFVYFIYINNNSMISISKDLPKELKKEFHDLRILMNTFLFVPLKKVKSFRTKVLNWEQQENK